LSKEHNDNDLVPNVMRVQLSRFFGSQSREARATRRTTAEWKRTLKRVLGELDKYISENVDTDDVHFLIILSGLCAADEALKEKNFWPGYAEGITRVALCLLGEYPDHRKRQKGRKAHDHYNLQKFRTVRWLQTRNQRLLTLFAAWEYGFSQLGKNPHEALREFRDQYGFRPSYKKFFDWYKKTYPADYCKVY